MSEIVSKIRERMADDWIPIVYRDEIRPLRTRAFKFGATSRAKRFEVHRTLLGFELKIGRKRLLCPDAATADYLLIFARIGVKEIAVPYDITKIPDFAVRMQMLWDKTNTTIDEEISDLSDELIGHARAQVINAMRREIEAAGAGDAMPLFRQNTSQRSE